MKNILVPISFSPTSKNALHHAFLIGKQLGAKLSLLHCYAVEEYARKYDFGALDYENGIKQMLVSFHKESVEDEKKQPFNLLTYSGSVSNIISEISHKYDLLVLGRKTALQGKLNNWLSDKIFYFTTKSLCPVLLLPTQKDAFNFSEINNIWHIKRKEIEVELIKQKLPNLKIDPSLVVSKSMQQETFTSTFWSKIVNYSRNHNRTELKEISESFAKEKIDLLILVNHRKGMFEQFLKDDAFKVISQFDIPILILQSTT